MAKAFSIEDGNLSVVPITATQTRSYSDIDLTLNKSSSGDIFSKTEAASVKQAIKNLLLTNATEKPFQPNFGGNLVSALFNLDTSIDKNNLRERIVESIKIFEPRVQVGRIEIDTQPERNSANITVMFRVISTGIVDTINLDVVRLK